jgi:hypothetical protein
VYFWPCKQDEKKMDQFEIPKRPKNSKLPDYFSILQKYIEVLNAEIRPTDNQTFWWRGATNEKTGKSAFVNEALGVLQFRKLPCYMATVSLNFITKRYFFNVSNTYFFTRCWNLTIQRLIQAIV